MDVVTIRSLMGRFQVGDSTNSAFIRGVSTNILRLWDGNGRLPRFGVAAKKTSKANYVRWDGDCLPVIDSISDDKIVIRAPIKVYTPEYEIRLDTALITIPFEFVAMLLKEMEREDIDDEAPLSYHEHPVENNLLEILGDLLPQEVRDILVKKYPRGIIWQLVPIDDRRSEVIISGPRLTKEQIEKYRRRKVWDGWRDTSYLSAYKSFYGLEQK